MKPYGLHDAAAFKLRGLLMVPGVALLLLWHRWEWECDAGVWATGLLVFAGGVVLRVWAQRHLKYRLREGNGLATSGPYTWSRNPVYVGNLLILAGLCVLCELPWMIPPICGWGALVYAHAVHFEEHRLTKRHGDEYVAYQQRVGRWWPRLPSVGRAIAPRVSGWGRAASVEWQCLVLLLIPMIKELAY
jgi:protein-S-isoprenylcysteine O-methyltransferase Ste14